MPALWNATTTQPSDRQAIVRQLVEQVAVTVVDGTVSVEVAIHWVGGYESRHEVRRRVASYDRLQEGDRVLTRVRELKHQGLSHEEVARRLNSERFQVPRGEEFTVPMVNSLWRRCRVLHKSMKSRAGFVTAEENSDRWLWRGGASSTRLEIPAATLNTWRRRGWIHAQHCYGHWLYWANEAELDRLMELRRRPRVALTPVPAELTIPTTLRRGITNDLRKSHFHDVCHAASLEQQSRKECIVIERRRATISTSSSASVPTLHNPGVTRRLRRGRCRIRVAIKRPAAAPSPKSMIWP